jgi:hypothetical protein
MALPRQVERQAREVEEIERNMAAPAEAQAENTDNQEASEPQATEVTQEVKPDQTQAQKPTDWEQKYKVIAGKYDAEVPRLHTQVRELSVKLQEALDQMKSLQEAPKETPKAAPLVSDSDVETFGQDLIDLQRRVAREVAAEFETKLSAMEARNAQLEAMLKDTGNQVGTMTFEQRLNRALPDFEALNADPQWIGWLDEVDPLIRAPRRVVAQDAFDRGDVEAIVNVVKLFREQKAPNKVDNRRAELERQVAPNRTSSTSTPSNQNGKVYTNAQVEAIYTKVRQLSIQGKFEEAQKLDAEISAAYVEGRVIP